MRHPRIVDVVEDLIGPDILVYTATFFIKEANSPTFAAWHQDATYFGLTPHEHVTAWVALSEASAEAGCMEMLSSRGNPRQMRHAALELANSINGGGQAIVDGIDEEGGTMMALPAGSFSLHHMLCSHCSAANRAGHRRAGIGISYIPAHCRLTGNARMCARLARGTGSYRKGLPRQHIRARYRSRPFEVGRAIRIVAAISAAPGASIRFDNGLRRGKEAFVA
jgi:non-heme Fe2+,alpha-ketoglutarate-dependent halogenase